ncbi:type II toxin-antitoxin system RelE/ParE family toxin [Marinospirillum minutulum]|uniref:type II toxin-antitoxin system RelE/ParE family toxin n=1 Tax=Marinospirillum minutulum TaxID=64974 RepID=UPI0003FC1426|nr:type II toxin-antitoxin system RelE/ParE family toxin [Marinospirillum minutulum]
MRVFKNRWFNQWATSEGLSDTSLLIAIDEINRGLVDANLGSNVFKKRIALTGKGKSGGFRTLLAYKTGKSAFFIYGFSKKARSNINTNELKALKHLAKEYFSYSDQELTKVLLQGALIEVTKNE